MSRRKPVALTQAIIYLRVSTEHQAASGLGLEAQEAACRAFCERQGWAIAGVYRDEGLSGTLPIGERPGLAAAVEALRAHGDARLVVYSLSRLARTQRQTWELLDDRGPYALPVISATEPFDTTTAMGKAFLGMMATFNALESDLASERTAAAMQAARARGVRLGAPSMADRARERPELAAGLRRVAELRGQGMTLRALVDRLNEEQVPTANGGRWHLKTVRTALGATGAPCPPDP
jgi:DNA invertase Pin-like site-specific DNA recombinase